MKNLIDTIKNIWRIEELRTRILITLGLLLVYRIGSYIVLPGVDSAEMARQTATGGGGIADILAIFTGGAFTRASIFALGIMPYISASIIMQLAGIAIPAVQKKQKEESGRRQLNQWTRYLTILICMAQAPGYLYTSIDAKAAPMDSLGWVWSSVMILTASTLFVMWLGERITERGLGNGISLIIMIGIIAQFPQSFAQEVVGRMGPGGGGLVMLLVEVVIWVLIIAGCILLVQGTRRIPVQFAKRVVGNKQYGGVRNYIPLKVNAAGVMPIIFAQAIVLIPMYIAQAPFLSDSVRNWMQTATSNQGWGYNIALFLMVVAFTYFYTAITVNPNQMADDMKRNGGFIPGVKPGKATASHIDELLSRITLPGAIFLGLVAVLPAFAGMMNIKQGFAQFFGGTSLLIMVGVLLDTLQQIESHLLMRHYDGLMKSGRIKGRNQGAAYGMAG
ncbi:MAG: preprotein translocase subunit SecY [Flavobacteriales bacterium]|jgi:preprotein translocase subunit SecY|nr:preprotein translocase subunit SecY [Flavobacteriales bacterium]